MGSSGGGGVGGVGKIGFLRGLKKGDFPVYQGGGKSFAYI